MRILYDNLVESATITAFSEVPEALFSEALVDTNLCRYGQTVDCVSEWIKFSFSAAVDVVYCLIFNHNLTSGATIKIQANSSDSWTAPAVDQAIVYDADVMYYVFSSVQNYRYWRITFADSANTDTHIKIGHIYLGEYLQFPGMELGQIIPVKSNSATRKTASGQLYGDKRLVYKSAEIAFQCVEQADKVLIDAFFETVDIVKPFILLIWENDLDVEPPIYCNFTDAPQWKRHDFQGLLWAFTFKIEECF